MPVFPLLLLALLAPTSVGFRFHRRAPLGRFQSSSSTIALNSTPSPNDKDNNPFVNPRIDDRGLPLADSLIAGIVAPITEVFICGYRQYSPSWLIATLPATSAFNNAIRLFPATLSHGAVLATCWVLGALASRSYEKEAFDVNIEEGKTSYAEPIKRVLKGGAFASGLLIVSTQTDLYTEYGRWVQPNETPEIDLRLLTAFAELFLDISVEAAWMIFWRVYRASITQRS